MGKYQHQLVCSFSCYVHAYTEQISFQASAASPCISECRREELSEGETKVAQRLEDRRKNKRKAAVTANAKNGPLSEAPPLTELEMAEIEGEMAHISHCYPRSFLEGCVTCRIGGCYKWNSTCDNSIPPFIRAVPVYSSPSRAAITSSIRLGLLGSLVHALMPTPIPY